MDRMEALIEDLTAAVRDLTAAIRAGGAAERTSTTGVRAGAAGGSEPIGTPVASIENDTIHDIDRSIDRSTIDWKKLSRCDSSEVDNASVSEQARVISKIIICKPERWRDDRRLVVVAAYLSVHLPEWWLRDALQASHGKRNTAAYFRTCLIDGLRRVTGLPDHASATRLWNRLSLQIPVPDKWLQEPKKKDKQKDEPPMTPEDMRWMRERLGFLSDHDGRKVS